ncbi:MAG: threonine/serine exporter family protein [Clostridia bacterium]|nr:threonine/serine exporter family protein [Clostridia bacterium]
MNIETILDIALTLGTGLMENGGETYRAEDTIERVCHAMGCESIEVFAIPTGVILTVRYNNILYTRLQRVHKSTIDLRIVTRLNELSRRIVSGEIEHDAIEAEVKFILASPPYDARLRSVSAGLSGGFFTLMFQGNLWEFTFSFIVSAVVSLMYSYGIRSVQSGFMKNIIGGFVTAALAIFLSEIVSPTPLTTYDRIIIGAIMPLVPGLAMTNAIRDSLSGELVAGVTKLAETLIIATGIAIGVGIALSLRLNILGG